VSGCSSAREDEQAVPTQNREVVAKPLAASADSESAETKKEDDVGKHTQTVPAEIDGVPLDVWPDVWFEDPLAVAASGAGTSVEPLKTRENKPQSEEEVGLDSPVKETSDSSARDWTRFVSADEIQLEVKDIRLTLRQAFQSVQRYNGQYKRVQVDGKVLAVLAAVVGEHPLAITWKDRAAHVRDLSAALADAVEGLGRKYYSPASNLYNQVDQLLSGNAPGKLKLASPQRAFEEFADRGTLMKRMQRADDWMKANASDEQSFQAETEQIRHESSFIALLTFVSSSRGYDLADEPEYQAQSQALIEAALDARQAAEKQNFTAFTDARERMKKACTACHLDFRFDEE